jgi:anion-transporting  ArsA/GET3 family ATPase
MPPLEPNPTFASALQSASQRNLIFVHGKGGVGKTSVSRALATRLARRGERTLWTTFEDPTRPLGECREKESGLFELNCDFTQAFEEYAGMKIGIPGLTRLFLRNKLMRYLSQAAPGIHELVLLGKVWFERTHYKHVVVDLPSTGHGLAMFQSTENFVQLFQGGPLHKDAQSMLETFENPEKTAHLIVALPEEMPLRESLELGDYLRGLFPQNPALYLVNRRFPQVNESSSSTTSPLIPPPEAWSSPLADSATDYALKRSTLETHNLRIWKEAGLSYGELLFAPNPRHILPGTAASEQLIQNLSAQLQHSFHL